jgi:hypothetical protein
MTKQIPRDVNSTAAITRVKCHQVPSMGMYGANTKGQIGWLRSHRRTADG